MNREPTTPVRPCTDDTSNASSMFKRARMAKAEAQEDAPSSRPRVTAAPCVMYPAAGVTPARPAI